MATERTETIRRLIVENGYLNLGDLAKQLNVSESTVRRDLQRLEKMGVLTRNHGGALINEDYRQNTPDGGGLEAQVRIVNQREKEAIGREAAKLVSDGEFIAIGSGTTCLQFARCLKEKRNLKIVTNNVPVAMELSCCPNIQVILAGGVSVFQNNCVSTLEIEEGAFGFGNVLASKIFCSVLGVDFGMGYSDINFDLLRTWKKMLQRAERSILLVTHEKFGKRGYATIAGLDYVDEIVTTTGIPDAYRAYYKEHNIVVHTTDY